MNQKSFKTMNDNKNVHAKSPMEQNQRSVEKKGDLDEYIFQHSYSKAVSER